MCLYNNSIKRYGHPITIEQNGPKCKIIDHNVSFIQFTAVNYVNNVLCQIAWFSPMYLKYRVINIDKVIRSFNVTWMHNPTIIESDVNTNLTK